MVKLNAQIKTFKIKCLTALGGAPLIILLSLKFKTSKLFSGIISANSVSGSRADKVSAVLYLFTFSLLSQLSTYVQLTFFAFQFTFNLLST